MWKEISGRIANTGQHPDGHNWYRLKVNAHVHTPYSFSSFDSIDSIIAAARKENISVLGINDFNTVDGYTEWADKCYHNGIYPLFNIEMIGLSRSDMKEGRKINDPNNPGRMYISGKALTYPIKRSEWNTNRLKHIRNLSNEHVRLMTRKVNELLGEIDMNLKIDFDEMLRSHTKGMARERHLAGMIRSTIEASKGSGKKRNEIFRKLLGDDFNDHHHDDKAGLENFIRSRLLKAGGAAYIEEDPDIFIEPGEIRAMILDAGGIPTYPFLADFNNGSYTGFEADREKAAASLMEQGFYSAEFIPMRNDYIYLRDYVMFLYDRGFIITFGTEHNAPGIEPLEVRAGGTYELDNDLQRINYESACIMAAHQYSMATGGTGFLDGQGKPKTGDREEFIGLGDKIIKTVCL